MGFHDRQLHRRTPPAKPVERVQSAYDAPSDHYLARVELTARYLPECRNQIRAMRAAGKQPCLPMFDEQFAKIMAGMRASDALRHGVREDIVATLQVAA